MKSIWFGSGFGFLAPTRRKHIFIHIYFILFSYCFHIFLYFSYCFRIYFIFISYLFCSCFQPRHSSPTATPAPPPGPTQALSACPARPGRKSCFFLFKCESTSKPYFQPYFVHIFFILFSFFSYYFHIFPYFSHIFLIGAYLLI